MHAEDGCFSDCDVLLIAVCCDITDLFQIIIHSCSYSYYPGVGRRRGMGVFASFARISRTNALHQVLLLVNVLKFSFMLVYKSCSL